MKFVCANADLVQNINLDTDYDYITASSKSLIMAVETLANSFTKSKSDCVLFVWNTNDPSDLVRATEEACVEDVNFKKIIDDLEKNLDYSILGDFDLESIELENGMTISVVKYVTMNNFVESKESARKSIKEERYDVELSDYSGSIVDEETFDKKSDAIQWAKDNGRNCYARIWDNEEGKTVKEWKVKSIKEANESVIIDGKKTNFKINDYGTFFGEKIKYMLIGEPSENEDVLADFLEENSNFEFEEYKIPYSTVYYIYNDEKKFVWSGLQTLH